MAVELVKGNDALLRGAVLAGCRTFYGYPITPSSEIAESAADLLPLLGGTFVQSECEVGAIQMVYGAASAGERVMTASSSPGISLKLEGISYLVGSELPAVIIDIMRGGPGLGNIAPAQGDYFQMVKGGGHGDYRMIVLAPNSPQEMCDLAMLAFDLADRYRNPVVVLSDGFTGQMMEAVEFPPPVTELPAKEWAVRGTPGTAGNLINSIRLMPEDLEEHVTALFEKYARAEAAEVRFEEVQTEDAELVLVGYGIVSRLLRAAMARLRERGLRVGMLRPITLWPFPSRRLAELADTVQGFMVAELSTGQMVEDVRLAVNGKRPVAFHGRWGGAVPSVDELVRAIEAVYPVEEVAV
jgi:pyruvate/2-oxoacid:ferredoxin oxidoreductase alpha subunit